MANIAENSPGTQPRLSIRVLSLDGGGTRGLSSLIFLRELMEKVALRKGIAQCDLRPSDYFDLIVGTGTGGISALFLGRLRMTVNEAIKAYLQVAKAAFQKPSVTSRVFHRLTPSSLERHLGDIVERFLKDRNAPLCDPLDSSPMCRTAVLVCTNADAGAVPHIFRSYSTSFPPCTVLEVASASIALAEQSSVVSLGDPPIQFISASLVGYNNPAEVAYIEAGDIWPRSKVKCLVSLGTGLQKIVQLGGRWRQRIQACELILQECEDVHRRMYESRLRRNLTYFRFNVPRGLYNVDIREWTESTSHSYIAGITSGYLRNPETSDLLDSCSQSLTDTTTNEILLAPENLGRAVNPQDALIQATHNKVIHIEDMIQRRSTQPAVLHEDDSDLPIYTQADVYILRTILKHFRLDSDTRTITALHEAERCDDGRVVFVRSYQGAQLPSTKHAFEQDLTLRRQYLTPSVLQLIGASAATSRLPIQVFHAPRGVLGTFKQWFMQTLSRNPVELIYALYNMRVSCWEFELFQSRNHIEVENRSFSDDIIVTKGSSRSRHEWSIVYTGELRRRNYSAYDLVYSNLILQTVAGSTQLDFMHNPAYGLIEAAFSSNWGGSFPDDTPDLEEILQRPYEDIDLCMLGATFFEQGWLRTRLCRVKPTCGKLGLGDIGYMMEGDRFVVVDNIHNLLPPASSHGGELCVEEGNNWHAYCTETGNVLEDTGGAYVMKHLEERVILGKSGRSYWRRRFQPKHDFGEFKSILYNLGYKASGAMQAAQKMLQEHAYRIIAQHSLTVPPHALMFVFYMMSPVFELEKIDRAATYKHVNDNAVDISGRESAEMNLAKSDIQHGFMDFPPLFSFTETQGPVHIRDSGTPELVLFRMSMEPEPPWLDEPELDFLDRRCEVKGGLSLLGPREIEYQIEYLQLPIDVAKPYITEV